MRIHARRYVAVGAAVVVTSMVGCDVSYAPTPAGTSAQPSSPPAAAPVFLSPGISTLSHDYPGLPGLAVKHAVVDVAQEASREMLSPEPPAEPHEVEAPQPFQHVH